MYGVLRRAEPYQQGTQAIGEQKTCLVNFRGQMRFSYAEAGLFAGHESHCGCLCDWSRTFAEGPSVKRRTLLVVCSLFILSIASLKLNLRLL